MPRKPLACRLYVATCWLPLAAFLVTRWDLERQEAWGAWAAAASAGPILVGFSAIMGALGVLLLVVERRGGRGATSLVMATLLASSVGLWFLARIATLEWSRGA